MTHVQSLIVAGGVAILASVAGAVTLDFETEDDFVTPLVNGQIVDGAFDGADLEFGNLVRISTTQGAGGHIGATIFDSTPGANIDDPDLQVGLGNILILQDNQHPGTTLDATYGLRYNQPDDEAALDAGSIIIDFLQSSECPSGACTMQSIDIVDANGGFAGQVILRDTQGLARTYSVPAQFTNDLVNEGPLGYGTIDLTNLAAQAGEGGGVVTAAEDAGFNPNGVVQLEVKLTGRSTTSAGIDNVKFIPEPSALAAMGTLGILTMLRRRR